MIEKLDSRLFLTTNTLTNGVLTISGNNADERVGFEVSGANLIVRSFTNGVANTAGTFTLANVNSLVISMLGGNDVVIVGSLAINATILGGSGNDTLFGGAGNDLIRGEGGFDFMNGRDGNDTLDGGAGSDYINGGSGRSDEIDYSTRVGGVRVGLGSQPDDGEAGENDNVWFDVEVVRGGLGDDIISTTTGRSVSLFGGAGNDTIDGGSGDDFIDGGTGRDLLSGLGGNDTFFARDGLIDTIFGGGGVDTADADPNDALNNIP